MASYNAAPELSQAKLASISYLDSCIPPEGATLSPSRVPELDHELLVLEEQILLARRRRNAHVSGLYKLPPEVLAIICINLKHVWLDDFGPRLLEDEDEPDVDPVYVLGWLNITHVCNRLREVALQLPSLWCDVECHRYPSGFRTAFESRSGDLPLRYSFDYDELELGQEFDQFESRGHWTRQWLTPTACNRLHCLEIISHPFFNLGDIAANFPVLPFVTDCTLVSECLEDPVYFDHEEVDLPFASPEQLSRLVLRGVFPSPSNLVFSSSITHLTLEARQKPHIPTIEKLLDMLSPLLQLQYLRLDRVPTEPAQLATTTHLPLPKAFRRLEYLGWMVPFIDLLSRIVLPPSCTINFKEDDLYRRPEGAGKGAADFARLVHTVRAAVAVPDDTPWTALLDSSAVNIIFGEDRSPRQYSSPADMPSAARSSSGDILTSLAYSHSLPRTHGHIASILDELPLAHLTSLGIGWVDDCPDHDTPECHLDVVFEKVRATAPNIRHLGLQSMPHALDVLKELAKTHVLDDSSTIPSTFPSLQAITFGVDTYVSEEDIALVQEALTAVVDTYKLCQRPLHELRIQRQFRSLCPWEAAIGTSVVFV
ncbi:unnamed protein product [Peniophora sp. CBMAI 1063]|nr:unnamed protein product [Peniophora sp. CBMAI 1063]